MARRETIKGGDTAITARLEEELAKVPAEVLAGVLIHDDDEAAHWTESARTLVAGLIELERQAAREKERDVGEENSGLLDGAESLQ